MGDRGQGANPCASTPDINQGSITNWGCSNPGYCEIDVSVTAGSNATGTYDVVVNAAGTGGSGFVASPSGSQAHTVSIDRGHFQTSVGTPVTVYLLHGIGQTSSDMASLKANLTNLPLSQLQSRFTVDAGFSFGQCSAVGKSCGFSQAGDTCSVDAGAKALARYILGSQPAGGNIVLIGYSMGGLIARDMIANRYLTAGVPGCSSGPPTCASNPLPTVPGVPGFNIVGLITLGTPNLGYPYDPADDFVQCPQLDQDMLGGWQPLLNTPLELPPLPPPYGSGAPTFFSKLGTKWASVSLPYWMAAAGSTYTNSVRTVPENRGIYSGGCITPSGLGSQPYSDGVVCLDSALYQTYSQFQGYTPGPAPNQALIWRDPEHNYVHTLTAAALYGLSGGSLFGQTTTGNLSQLFDPKPFGLLFQMIVNTLNGNGH